TVRAPGRPAAAGPAGGSTLRRSACSPRRPPTRSGLRPRREGQVARKRGIHTGGPVGVEDRKEDDDALEAACRPARMRPGPGSVERVAARADGWTAGMPAEYSANRRSV